MGRKSCVTHGGVGSKLGTHKGVIYSNEGAKGWCVTMNSGLIFDSFKNLDYREGTILFWLRRDKRRRNENRFKAVTVHSFPVFLKTAG